MKDKTLYIKDQKINLESLKAVLTRFPGVSAAYLFGSSASGRGRANDLDLLVLLGPDADKNEAYLNLTYKLSQDLKVDEGCIDLVFFDIEETEPAIITKAVNTGVLLVNHDENYLSEMIDCASRHFMFNEAMLTKSRILRKERIEVISADR